MTKYSFQELAWSVGVPKVAREVLLQVPELIAKAVAEEREACAKLCDDWPNGRDDVYSIAASIRARGDQ
jgi:hypothetical protein